MSSLNFLKKFKNEIKKIENVSIGVVNPTRWYTTGNFAINRVLSGSYRKAIPQTRMTAIVGPSQAGKSYVLCNIIRSFQELMKSEGKPGVVLVLDSENALDLRFMTRAGVDVNNENFIYAQIVTIQDVTEVVSDLFKTYDKDYGKFNKDAPEILIVLDSLGNCLTNAEDEKFTQGKQTGDQGQSAKTKKHLLRTLVSRLPRYNASMVFTDQVYPADPMMGQGSWAVTNGIQFAASQILLLTKLRLRENSQTIGIRMKLENFKSRFVQQGTNIEIEIPYSVGITPFAGLIEVFERDGVITKEGYSFVCDLGDEQIKFKASDLNEEIIDKILSKNKKALEIEAEFDDFEIFNPEPIIEEVIGDNTGDDNE